jgi:hypothetical protein
VQLNDPHAETYVEYPTVLAAVLGLEARMTGLKHRVDGHTQVSFGQIGPESWHQGLLNEFVAPVSQHATGRLVDFEEAQGLGVDQVDAVARLIDDRAVLLLALGQRLPRMCLGGNVAETPDAPLFVTE